MRGRPPRRRSRPPACARSGRSARTRRSATETDRTPRAGPPRARGAGRARAVRSLGRPPLRIVSKKPAARRVGRLLGQGRVAGVALLLGRPVGQVIGGGVLVRALLDPGGARLPESLVAGEPGGEGVPIRARPQPGQHRGGREGGWRPASRSAPASSPASTAASSIA